MRRLRRGILSGWIFGKIKSDGLFGRTTPSVCDLNGVMHAHGINRMRNTFRRKDQAVCMRLLCTEPGK